MIGRGVGFTRWYDRNPELSQGVRMLEKCTPFQQRLVANHIIGSMQLHQVAQRSEHGLKKLGTEKITGLMKAKGKRRWYDQDPVVHKAFNHLYLMDETMRHEFGVKIIVAVQALEEAQRQFVPERTQHTLVKTVFDKPLNLLMEQMAFVLQPAEKERAEIQNGANPPGEAVMNGLQATADSTSEEAPELKEDLRPASQPPVFRPTLDRKTSGSRITASPEGLKLIHRLQPPSG